MDIQKPPTKPCMPWQCKSNMFLSTHVEYYFGISHVCVCLCVSVCVTQDAMKILCGCMGWYGLEEQPRLSRFRFLLVSLSVAAAKVSSRFAMCFPRED
jgi:hypothetical protein